MGHRTRSPLARFRLTLCGLGVLAGGAFAISCADTASDSESESVSYQGADEARKAEPLISVTENDGSDTEQNTDSTPSDADRPTAWLGGGTVRPPVVAPRPQIDATGNPQTITPVSASDTNPDGSSPDESGPTGEGGPKLLIAENSFEEVGPRQAIRVSYDDLDLLKVLNMEPVLENAPDYFPSWLNDLDGQTIRIRGWMYPPDRETGIRRFVLARDNGICCFGRDPKPYDVIPVRMKPGTDTRYIQNRPFDVVGKFHIDMFAYKGIVDGVYRIDEAQIIPAR